MIYAPGEGRKQQSETARIRGTWGGVEWGEKCWQGQGRFCVSLVKGQTRSSLCRDAGVNCIMINAASRIARLIIHLFFQQNLILGFRLQWVNNNTIWVISILVFFRYSSSLCSIPTSEATLVITSVRFTPLTSQTCCQPPSTDQFCCFITPFLRI